MTQKKQFTAARPPLHVCRGRHTLCAVLLLLMLVITAAQPLHFAKAAELEPDFPWLDTVSFSDASDSDIPPEDIGNFERVSMVPMNVEIPEFYREVVNVSGMYIFTLNDGTVYKRIYGSLDGVYGWYEPVGPRNYVLKDSMPINTDNDIRLYKSSEAANPHVIPSQDYSGILRPDESVTNVVAVFGVPMASLFFYGGIGALLLCLVILIASRIADRRKHAKQSATDFDTSA